MFITPIFSVELIYPLEKDKTWVYKIGATTISNSVIDSKIIKSEAWYRTSEFGFKYWLCNRADGVYMTHAKIHDGEELSDTFLLFPKDPKLGKTWNPDGVEISVLSVGDMITVNGKQFKANLFSFAFNEKETVLIWFANGTGVVKQVDNLNGKLKIYTLQTK